MFVLPFAARSPSISEARRLWKRWWLNEPGPRFTHYYTTIKESRDRHKQDMALLLGRREWADESSFFSFFFFAWRSQIERPLVQPTRSRLAMKDSDVRTRWRGGWQRDSISTTLLLLLLSTRFSAFWFVDVPDKIDHLSVVNKSRLFCFRVRKLSCDLSTLPCLPFRRESANGSDG